jgi:hypothetical protein
MSQDELFDLSPEESFDSFDPLADVDDVDEYDFDAPIESGVVRTDPAEFPDMDALAQISEDIAKQPAYMRIATLFENMKHYKKMLLAIMEKCMEPTSEANVLLFIEELSKVDKSTYAPEIILQHLFNAGALKRQTEDGQDYETLDFSPKTVIINGMEFLKPCTPPEIFWKTSKDGEDVVNANKPLENMKAIIIDEPQYRHIYKIVLEQAASENGATEKSLAPLVNDDPALQKPRMYAPRFIDKLSENSSVAWSERAWRITDTGKAVLAYIEELNDAE